MGKMQSQLDDLTKVVGALVEIQQDHILSTKSSKDPNTTNIIEGKIHKS